MSTRHVSVKTEQDAWFLVEEFVQCVFEKNKHLSERAGYSIYQPDEECVIGWVSDLNTCLECVFHNGNVIKIWITDKFNEDNKDEIKFKNCNDDKDETIKSKDEVINILLNTIKYLSNQAK